MCAGTPAPTTNRAPPPAHSRPQYGNGTLRLTTRQAYQLHGVLKHDLKTVFSTVVKNMGSTLGACGDVNRNVMGPAAPYKSRPEYVQAQKTANDLADLLAPQSGAYYDVWLDGEKFVTAVKEVGGGVEGLWGQGRGRGGRGGVCCSACFAPPHSGTGQERKHSKANLHPFFRPGSARQSLHLAPQRAAAKAQRAHPWVLLAAASLPHRLPRCSITSAASLTRTCSLARTHACTRRTPR